MSGPHVPAREGRPQRGLSLAMLMSLMFAAGACFTFWMIVADTSPAAAAERDRAGVRVGMTVAEVLDATDGWEIAYADTANGQRITMFRDGAARFDGVRGFVASHGLGPRDPLCPSP